MKTYIYKVLEEFRAEVKFGKHVVSRDMKIGDEVYSDKKNDPEINKLLAEGKIQFYKESLEG